MICLSWFSVLAVILGILAVKPITDTLDDDDTNPYCGRKECPLFYEEWVIHVSGGRATAKQVARLSKLVLVDELPGFLDHYVLRASKAKDIDLHRNKRHAVLAKSPHVNWAQRQFPLIRQKRASEVNMNWNDRHYSDMWYINRAREGMGYDMNVQEAWNLGYSGKGVVVTIMDDGVEHTHPDLKQNYDPKASCDLSDEDDDPMPDLKLPETKHGTRCAGQVAAQGNNSICVVGVAFNARIGGIRMLDGYITDRVEARSLSFQNNYIDIYSGSWGPDDTGKMLEGPGHLASSALQKGVTTGRHGLGSIFIWASGNGGVTGDSCACDGYASSPYTLSVSGVGENNTRPWYVERCTSTLVTTYSSGSDSERMISTVDTHHKCTSKHTGTSASAPLAASIIALLLEANPKLTWRDVQYICILTANTIPFLDGNFTKNAVGRAYSEYYGFGLMDAGKMIRLGELWRTVPQQHQCTSVIQTFKIPLENRFNHTILMNFTGCSPTNQQANQADNKNASQTQPLHYLEHVQLYGEIIYPRRGLLQITLISPSGTESVLLPPRILDDHSGETNILKWPLTSVQFWGEPAAGSWQVRIDNLAGMHELLTVDEHRIQEMYRRRPRNLRQLQSLHQAGESARSLKGVWRSVWLVFYGSTEFPIRLKPPSPQNPPPKDWFANFSSYVVHDAEFYDVYTCHSQCSSGGCTGPLANQCLGGCLHFATQSGHCVPTCPPGTTAYGIRDRQKQTHYRENRVLLSKLSRWQNHLNSNQPFSAKAAFSTESNDGVKLVCQPCSSLCSSCLRPYAEFECTACADGRYLVPLLMPNTSRVPVPQDTSADLPPSVVGACKIKCPEGYYANKATGICQRCAENCAVCTSLDSSDCQICRKGYRLVNGRCLDGQSVDGRCRTGQYIQKSKCVNCPSWCNPAGCLPNGECISCRYPLRYLHNYTCVEACPSGWYPGYSILPPYVVEHGPQLAPTATPSSLPTPASPRLCEPCPPGCLQCADFSQCHQCASTLELSEGRCVKTNRTNQQCNPPCSTCLYGNEDCAMCDENIGNYLLAVDLVMSDVEEGSLSPLILLNRRHPVSGKSRTSARVDVSGDAISVAVATVNGTAPLVDIDSRGFNVPTFTCSTVCPTGTFPASSDGSVAEALGAAKKLCRACPPSCTSCINAEHCTDCRKGFHLDGSTNTCHPNEQCRVSSYFDVIKKTCLPCHADCDMCAGPTAEDCTSCQTRAPTPYCLDVKEPQLPPGGQTISTGDNLSLRNSMRFTKGRCVVCCDYMLALVSRILPDNCGFCLADRVACLNSVDMLIEQHDGWLFLPEDGIHRRQPPQSLKVSSLTSSTVNWNKFQYVLLTILVPIFIVGVLIFVFICCRISKRLGYFNNKSDQCIGVPGSTPTTTAVTRREARLHARHRQAIDERKEVVQLSMSAQNHRVASLKADKASSNYSPGGPEVRRFPPAVLNNGSVQRWPQHLSTSTVNNKDPHQHVLYSQLTQSTIDRLDDDDHSSVDEDGTGGATHASQTDEFIGHRTTMINDDPSHNGINRISSPASSALGTNGTIPTKTQSLVDHDNQNKGDAISKPLIFRPRHRKPLKTDTHSNVV